ncbi:Transmembrane protein 184C [Seminavis robusta]|uniref:Transmembrane protein 184C n=1 Tax=Seminavis robusta TaxID=568900 RepID=A0A9N8ELM1_9STRA|nr:Transmembrane protein 184C [Seminavis robusta]|eukprot:Sro1289_g259690.1 Transmembrane protein 184C (579) ;mRNA; f:11228-12964
MSMSSPQIGGGGGIGYNRVPTTATSDDVGSPPRVTIHASSSGTSTPVIRSSNNSHAPSEHSVADDSMQQSLLFGAPGGDGEEQQSPPQLHCLLAAALESWNLLFPHIRRMGNFLFGITLLTMLFVVPMVTYSAIEENRVDVAAFDSSGVMVLGTLVLSFRLVYLHLSHWYMPEVQKYVVRIVWMVPLYAVQSWLSLRFREARIYIDAIRDLYEAFVIASFLYYLIELLGGQQALVRILESKAETQPHLGKHAWPLNQILPDWQLGTEFMLQCKHGVLQYVVVKTAATILTYMFETAGCYGEGEFHWNSAYPYMAFLLNTSVMYALYVLVMLFHAVHGELQHPINWRPLGKFLCVKGVVFFTWWQGVIIYFLKAKGFIKDTAGWSGDEISNAVIDYCICTEMVFFAVAHSYTFSYKEYLPSSIPPELRNLTLNANNQVGHTGPGSSSNSNNTPTSQPLRLQSRESLESQHSAVTAETRQSQGLNPTYRPPQVLDQRWKFSDGLRSSFFPEETIQDIRRMRSGVATTVQRTSLSGSISLAELQTAGEEATQLVEQQQDESNADIEERQPLARRNSSGSII